ncbi:TetR/AcrR family transcriptional regulator [Phenylobacterium sp. J367]|uniref:TetR/AcrR family transcriptional regulator n=1 Tax=Phenylobacterium sp. J367 TaxID=2898435 RepID=UPI0035B0BD8C
MSAATTTARRSARKAKGDGHLRRAEILEAAERIFIAEGYEGATIRKIADEVGSRRPRSTCTSRTRAASCSRSASGRCGCSSSATRRSPPSRSTPWCA